MLNAYIPVTYYLLPSINNCKINVKMVSKYTIALKIFLLTWTTDDSLSKITKSNLFYN